MRIFDDGQGWSSKVNFVDDNNVFVGFDTAQDCCEDADWFISDTIAEKIPSERQNYKELEGYNFDKDFFKEIDSLGKDYNELDAGGMVVFRLANGEDEKYLHLFNCHNGYYGHGFEVKHGGEIVKTGYL